MKTEQAIKLLEGPVYKWSMRWDERDDGLSYCDAIQEAINALKEKQRQEALRHDANLPFLQKGDPMENSIDKFCPLRGCKCNPDDCAWWCDFAKDCAVPLMAGMFADSEICNTVFCKEGG